jgi:hypothetical protein
MAVAARTAWRMSFTIRIILEYPNIGTPRG